MLRTAAGQDLSPVASGFRETDPYSLVHHLLNKVVSKNCCIYGA